MKVKVIKIKDFTVNESAQKHFTCAYKGRVFGVSTLRFEESDLSYDDKESTLKFNVDVEVMVNKTVDQLTGEAKTYLDIVPKLGLNAVDF
mgnify:FL=1